MNLFASATAKFFIGAKPYHLMASSEGPSTEPFRIVPAVQNTPGSYSDSLLGVLAEMAKHDMRCRRGRP